ncbi:MAG TPA: sulfur carrier protein ThiS [Acidimicrobiales bacterium]|nr:sulfur carrier protein ThiS [Acidimicrobiales bacterium]
MTRDLKVLLNGEPVELSPGATISDVISFVGCGERGVAVSVNSQLRKRAEWASTEIGDGDRVEILHAVAGG